MNTPNKSLLRAYLVAVPIIMRQRCGDIAKLVRMIALDGCCVLLGLIVLPLLIVRMVLEPALQIYAVRKYRDRLNWQAVDAHWKRWTKGLWK